ncbi:MAG: epoxyqueuosine reductase QueH [Acutalibacteraceae bacterium]
MINYQKELEKLIEKNQKEGTTPSLLLHACCAPCSSYCLEYLSDYFKITVFYYNPNISPESEYVHRVAEEKRLISSLNVKNKIDFIEGEFNPTDFYEAVKGLEDVKEGGERCFKCYRLRLEQTAKLAQKLGFDYFTTTLTISPLKNAEKINEIGEELSEKYGVMHLPSDFKKKDGYKRSIELSKQFLLYRQDYCGCAFSKAKRQKQVTDSGIGQSGNNQISNI